MLDIDWIRENPILLDWGLSRRNHKPMSEEVLKLDSIHRSVLMELEEIRAKRNQLASKIANSKKQSQDINELVMESKELKIRENILVGKENESYNKFIKVMETLPNMPAGTTWEGMAKGAIIELREDYKKVLEDCQELECLLEKIIKEEEAIKMKTSHG